jgi:hypothetical protein
MRGRRVFYDLPLQYYKHHKKRKNRKFIKKSLEIDQKSVFFVFCDAYNIAAEGRRKRGDLSFCSEFYALSNGYIENIFSRTLEDLELRWRGFSRKLSSNTFF